MAAFGAPATAWTNVIAKAFAKEPQPVVDDAYEGAHVRYHGEPKGDEQLEAGDGGDAPKGARSLTSDTTTLSNWSVDNSIAVRATNGVYILSTRRVPAAALSAVAGSVVALTAESLSGLPRLQSRGRRPSYDPEPRTGGCPGGKGRGSGGPLSGADSGHTR